MPLSAPDTSPQPPDPVPDEQAGPAAPPPAVSNPPNPPALPASSALPASPLSSSATSTARTPSRPLSDEAWLAALPPAQPPLVELYDMPSPLKADRFRALLSLIPSYNDSPYTEIANQIEHGFDLGIEPPVKTPFFPSNSELDEAQTRALDKAIEEDVLRRRLAGPYEMGEAERDTGLVFRSNPLSAARKDTPPGEEQKWRAVENLSFPYKPRDDGVVSINSTLDSARFPSRWTKLATFLDIRPEQRPFHAIIWRGALFFRKTPSFGGATTPGVFCNVVDATLDALEQIWPSLITSNIVDDLFFARVPTSPPSPKPCPAPHESLPDRPSTTELLSSIDDFGWLISKEKLQDWSFEFIFGGLGWRSEDKVVYLPPRKAAKYARRLEAFTRERGGGKKTVEETMKIVGTLSYLCVVFPPFRPYLRPLLEFRRSFPFDASPMLRHQIGRTVYKSLSAWLDLLRSAASTSLLAMSYNLPSSFSPSVTWTDASPDGLGVVIDHEWTTSQTLVGRGREIANAPGGIVVAEGWAVELAASMWEAAGATACALSFACDNVGVLEAWARGRSRNRLLNDSITRLLFLCSRHHLLISMCYVASEANPADGPSRGVFAPHLALFPLPLPPAPGTTGSCLAI